MAMFRNDLIACGCQCFFSILALTHATERIRLERLLLQTVYGTNMSTTMIIILSALFRLGSGSGGRKLQNEVHETYSG